MGGRGDRFAICTYTKKLFIEKIGTIIALATFFSPCSRQNL